MYQCICQLSGNSDLFKDHVQASPGVGGGAELSYIEGGWGLAQVDDRAQRCGSKVGGYHEWRKAKEDKERLETLF